MCLAYHTADVILRRSGCPKGRSLQVCTFNGQRGRNSEGGVTYRIVDE